VGGEKAAHQAGVVADTQQLTEVWVRVTVPEVAKSEGLLKLPAELRPAREAVINARVGGYVRAFHVDLGAEVVEGDLLAEIDAPEIERDAERAQAQHVQASAALALAETTAKRWKDLLESATASQQEADEKFADVNLKRANVEAAAAEMERVKKVLGFAQITAPFAGRVIARTLEVGQLVDLGGKTELFRIADVTDLRAFVRVPQGFARSIAVGQKVVLSVPELKGETREGTVTRTAGAIDPQSRTLLTEVQVDNRDGGLLSGSFAQVELPDAQAEDVRTVPANCLMIRAAGPMAVVVDGEGAARFRKLQLGRDYGARVEVLEGISDGERVVLNPPDILTEGMTVRISESK
jgi:RND family efflux transporter MFP subunit